MDDEEQVLDEIVDGDEQTDEQSSDSDSGSDDSAPPKDEGSDDSGDKRVNDLMSKWQQAEARAKKAEAALAAKTKGAEAGDQGGDAGDAADGTEFLQFARQNARESLYKSEPRLAKYGFSSDDIAGDTLTEMKASFTAHVKRINGMESVVRREILTQHGLDPEVSVSTGGSQRPVDFATMSDDDFEKFLAKRDSLAR